MSKPGISWKWWVGGGIVAASVLAGSGYHWYESSSRPDVSAQEIERSEEEPAQLHVEVTYPRKGEFDRTTTQPGSVQAFESVRLFSEVSGYLKTQTVDIGDQVTKGQVLATIDVPELDTQIQRNAAALDQARARVIQMRARVTSAQADLEAAKAMVIQAKATARSKSATLRFREQQLQRFKELVALKSIAASLLDEEYEKWDAATEAQLAAVAAITTTEATVAATTAKIQAAEADVVEAEAEVKVAQAELDKAKVLVQFSTIVAPFKGVVTQRSLFPNDFVRAAKEGGAQVPLLTVHRTDLMRVVVHIPDRDVPYADKGDAAIVEIDAMPGEKFRGVLARKANSEDPDTRLMRVEIDLPNPSGKICNGMYGQVTILLEKSNLLSVPSSCLVGKAEDGKGSVYVVRDGRAHLTPVRLGPDNGLLMAIVSGLTAEDAVCLHPGSAISDGSVVTVSSPQAHSGAK